MRRDSWLMVSFLLGTLAPTPPAGAQDASERHGPAAAQPDGRATFLPWVGRRAVHRARVVIRPHQPALVTGRAETFDIVLEGASAISVIQLEITFDRDRFMMVDDDCASAGVQLPPPTAQVEWWHSHVSLGRASIFTALQPGASSGSGPDAIVLGQFRARAAEPGAFIVSVEASAWDSAGAVLDTRSPDTTVQSHAVQPLCPSVSPGRFQTLTIEGSPSHRPAEAHPDLNLRLRGWTASSAYDGLVEAPGESDPAAPQLAGLVPGQLSPARPVRFSSAWSVRDWDWATDQPGSPLRMWPVTLAGLPTQPGATLHLPPSGYHIGSGFGALVLLATGDQVTLKYTREDNVVEGYTLHLEGLCVDPGLVSRYDEANARGRRRLPALADGQAFATAASHEVLVAIRDSGAFMDPRIRKDWWVGFPETACRP